MRLFCNCENIQVYWHIGRQKLVARVCSCQYCRKMAAEYVSDCDSHFSFTVKIPSHHKIVQHGHNTATFHECSNCGLALVTCQIKDVGYGILNAKVMGLSSYSLDPIAKDYSNESIHDRLTRREANWCRLVPN